MKKDELEFILEKSLKPIFDEVAYIKKQIDRKADEISTEVNASVQFMEFNEESIHKDIESVRSEIKSLISETSNKNYNNGVDLLFISEVSGKAVNNIFDILENIEVEIDSSNLSLKRKQSLKKMVSNIYTECEFQDLIGQRVSRVIGKLEDLKNSFNSNSSICDFIEEEGSGSTKIEDDISQDEIDNIFDKNGESS
jgi:acetylglutamate synthase